MQIDFGTEDKERLKELLRRELSSRTQAECRASIVIAELMGKLNLCHNNNPNTEIKRNSALSEVFAQIK